MPLPTIAQAAGALAMLVGIFLALPLPAALLAGGALLLVLATLAEAIVRGRPTSPPARRSGPQTRPVV